MNKTDATVNLDPAGFQEHALLAANYMTELCHGLARSSGWWTDLDTGEFRAKPVPEALMLIVTEVGEAMEAWRKNRMDDHLPHRPGIEVELADVIIRVFDFAGGHGLDIAGAVADKLAYNAQRADHKLENRRKDDGKKC